MTTSWFRICSLLVLLLALVGGAPEARADKKKAMEHWNRGNTAYTLGKFVAAIGHFEQAYVEHPAPAFLFNIAQCHRQLKSCEKASFFYRRYLSAKPDADNRPEVEGYIAEMDTLCAAQSKPGPKPADVKPEPKPEPKPADVKPEPKPADVKPEPKPADVEPEPKPEPKPADVEPEPKPAPDTTRVAMNTETGGGDSSAVAGGDTDSGLRGETAVDDAILVATVQAGPTFLSMGELDVPVQASVNVAIGYPLRFGSIGIEPGVAIQSTAISYDDRATGTANLLSVLANVPVRYAVASKLHLRGELGVGVLMFTGLSEGNPFTEGGRGTTGALSMINVRLALGVDYAITHKLIATFTPLAMASSPAKEGLHESMDSIASFDVLAGLGYRF